MNTSLWSANAVTHIKIIMVSLAAATLFAAVGITAQISNGIQQASASIPSFSAVLVAAQIPTKIERDLRQIKLHARVGSLSDHLKPDSQLKG